MEIYRIFALSGAGMSAQRSRMTVVAGNMANAETTRTPEGGPYRKRHVLFRAVPLEGEFSTLGSASLQERPVGSSAVEVAGVRESQRPPKKVYDPQHPDADPEGYVSYPDINIMEEVTDLLSAVRSYEANMAAFNATKMLVRRLLEIGRQP